MSKTRQFEIRLRDGTALDLVDSRSTRGALAEWVATGGLERLGSERGRILEAHYSGRRLAILGVGFVEAVDVSPVAREDELPPLETMRAELLRRGRTDASLLDADAVEAGYRANVLREFIPHRPDWKAAGGSTRRAGAERERRDPFDATCKTAL